MPVPPVEKRNNSQNLWCLYVVQGVNFYFDGLSVDVEGWIRRFEDWVGGEKLSDTSQQ